MKQIREQNSSWNYFGNCGICGAMKKADRQGRSLSLPELRNVFREAHKAQASTVETKRRHYDPLLFPL